MPRLARPLLCLACLLSPAWPAPAQDKGKVTSEIIDDAGMFSDAAIREARSAMARLDRAYGVAVTIETVASLRGQGIDEVATRRAEQLGHPGIFVLIAKGDRKAKALASPRALREEIGQSRLDGIRDALYEELHKGQVDAGLAQAIQAVSRGLAAARPEKAGVAMALEAASGSTSPMVVRHQVRLTLAGARKALGGAEAKAAEKGYKMNIAVVDDGGHLIAFGRMDGARPASVATATTKAITAATYRAATGPLPGNPKESDVLLNLSLQNAAAASGGKVTTLFGGVPIQVDNQVIGALGVGGGTGEQDAEVARAGVEAFLAELKIGNDGTKAAPRDSEPADLPPPR